MSGANQLTVSVTDSTEGRPEDSVSQKPSSQDDPHTPNPTIHVPEQSNSQKLLATDVLLLTGTVPMTLSIQKSALRCQNSMFLGLTVLVQLEL